MFAAVSNTPHRISSAGTVNCENAIPNAMIAAARAADDPFALEPVGKARGQQRRNRIGERDDEGILQALGDGDAFFDQQRRHPIGKTIEAEGLAEIEHHEQHDQRQVGRLEQLGKTALSPRAPAHVLRRASPWRAGAGAATEASSVRRILTASSVLPWRASQSGLSGTYSRSTQITMLRGGADQHHPAPAIDPVGRQRHQPPRQGRDDGDRDEHDGLIDRKGAAAHPARHQFGDIGVDGDDLDADADPGDEAPQQQAAGGGLARHHHGGRACSRAAHR